MQNHYSKQSSEKELVAGCRQQNRLAQRYLYERFYSRLLAVCMRYTSHRDEAEDVMNRAFLKIFQKINEYEEQGSLNGWMATITLRTAIDYVRSKVKYKEVMDFDSEEDVALEAEAMNDLYAADIFSLIQKLPPTSRTVFSLNAVEGYTHKEISEMLGININTSKWHLTEAKKQLREWVVAMEKRVIKNELKLAFLSKIFF